MNNLPYRIVLASGSPRRRELLAGLGFNFEVRLLPDIDESFDADLPGEEIASTISRKKAEAYKSTISDDELIITADTIVYIDRKVLGKPKDDDEARDMLHTLSGRTHQVITGVTLLTTEKQLTFCCNSSVTFSRLTEEDINYYINNYHPLDKAGAYGIQEWIGYIGVERIEGSYFNVMGLPVQRLYKALKSFTQ